jgi:hypothetical protein
MHGGIEADDTLGSGLPELARGQLAETGRRDCRGPARRARLAGHTGLNQAVENIHLLHPLQHARDLHRRPGAGAARRGDALFVQALRNGPE